MHHRIRTLVASCCLGAAPGLAQQHEPGPVVHGEGVGSAGLHERFEHAHGAFLELREKFDPDIELRLRAMPNARIGEEPGSFDQFGFDVDLQREVPIADDTFLLFGAYVHRRRYETSPSFGTANNVGGLGDLTLLGAGVRLGVGWFASDDVLVELEANPGVFNDAASDLYGKSFDSPATLLVSVRTAPDFFVKAGVRYNRIFEEEPVLPYLGFSWRFGDGFRLDVLAPEEIEVSWWPEEQTGFMAGVFARGAEYHVTAATPTGTQHADAQVEEVIAYLGLAHRFDRRFSLQARAGVTIAGGYDLTDGSAGFDRTEGQLDHTFYADLTFGVEW